MFSLVISEHFKVSIESGEVSEVMKASRYFWVTISIKKGYHHGDEKKIGKELGGGFVWIVGRENNTEGVGEQ